MIRCADPSTNPTFHRLLVDRRGGLQRAYRDTAMDQAGETDLRSPDQRASAPSATGHSCTGPRTNSNTNRGYPNAHQGWHPPARPRRAVPGLPPATSQHQRPSPPPDATPPSGSQYSRHTHSCHQPTVPSPRQDLRCQPTRSPSFADPLVGRPRRVSRRVRVRPPGRWLSPRRRCCSVSWPWSGMATGRPSARRPSSDLIRLRRFSPPAGVTRSPDRGRTWRETLSCGPRSSSGRCR